MAKLSNFSGEKGYITIGQMARDYKLGDNLILNPLNFADGEIFISGDDLDNFIGDYTSLYYMYNVPKVATSVNVLFLNDLNFYWNLRKLDFEKLYNAIYSTYNPIENYSMTEETSGKDITENVNSGTDEKTIAKTGEDTTKNTGTDTMQTEGTKKTQAGISTKTTNGETSATSENKVSAYDSDDLTVKDSNTTTVNENFVNVTNSGTDIFIEDTTNTTTKNLTNVATYGSNIKDTTIYGKEITDTTIYGKKLVRSGNIGVTTSQQMIESEYVLRLKHSLQELFIIEFLRTYCY